MTYGVIDIGSNSVRLMKSDGVKALYKEIKITKLAEGLGIGNILAEEAVERTAQAVSFFVNKAKSEKVDKLFVFATAAARVAKNANLLQARVKELCGEGIDILSGEKEALLGIKGALSGKDGGVIDIGGASSEIIVVKEGNVEYSHSLNIGSVKLLDRCKDDKDLTKRYVKGVIEEYGEIPNSQFYAIGGTATTVAALLLELEQYNPEMVDGYKIEKDKLKSLMDKLFSLTVEERKKLKGLQPQRADVIAGGVTLLYYIMEKLNISFVTASEKDNLEGYLSEKI